MSARGGIGKARPLRFALRSRRRRKHHHFEIVDVESMLALFFLTCLMYIAAFVLRGLGRVSGRPSRGKRQAGRRGRRRRGERERGDKREENDSFSFLSRTASL